MKPLLLVAVAMTLAACGNGSVSSDTSSSVEPVATTVAGTETPFVHTMTVGENTGPDVVIEVELGMDVVLNVVNPVSHDEIHLHDYDLTTGSIEKGERATISFTASRAGDFVIESHETGDVVSTLRVVTP